MNWTGSGPDANWSTLLNWNGSVPGSTSVTNNSDTAVFNAAIANTCGNTAANPVVFDSTTQNIGSISFDGAAGNYFIGSTAGNALKLSSGGSIQILNTLTAPGAVQTINAPLQIQGANGTYTFANNSANGGGPAALHFGGRITGSAGNIVLALTGENTDANTLSGNIADGTATSVAITKSGSGTWTLSGANTYSGLTTVSAGFLNLNSPVRTDAIAGNGSTSKATPNVLIDGGTLRLLADHQINDQV